ncbi:hypothetical protein BE04_11675 [Sorangium cellulosum]|uniref:Uncharacterized protein n=1 Tax=Sorangium cellulosum TaxID=56 RepID=A0A150Q1M0_SORCE|nr:hypothetical protein BE04_11675 [Sorangium cellulosum]
MTAVRDTFERSRDFRDKLCRASDLLTAAGYRPVPAVLPGPWQLAAQAVLGWSPDVRQSVHRQQAILDLRTLTIRGGLEETEVQLSRTIAHLLAILAIAGDDGLALGDVKQLLLERSTCCGGRPRAARAPHGGRWDTPGRGDGSRSRIASTSRRTAPIARSRDPDS